MHPDFGRRASPPNALGWRALPPVARLYVAAVIAVGACGIVVFVPFSYPRPLLFAMVLVVVGLTSAWKVNLPISLASGSTLSVSYAADLMALLLLGPRHAMLAAVTGAWIQCKVNVKQPYPLYRTVFSVTAEAITMAATGLVYRWLGGPTAPFEFSGLPGPLVGASTAYFLVNTGLVAGAIAFSTTQPIGAVWHDDFLWSGPSFMVAGAAGAAAAVIIQRGDSWTAVLVLAPVYLTYRTYRVFLGRLSDQTRHVEETKKLHEEAVDFLRQARRAEGALAEEKERVAVTLRSIGDGVIATDMDGTILLLNNAAEALTGWPHEEAVGKPLVEVFQNVDPETRVPRDNSPGTLTGNQDKVDGRRCTVLVSRDLTERPVEVTAAPLRDAEGQTLGMVIAFRDTTDTLRIQEEHEKAARVDSLGLLAGGIAHDFNNILMTVMGNICMARATVQDQGPTPDWLGKAEQACLRTRQLTWELLAFSRGGLPAKKRVALAHVLEESTRLTGHGFDVSFTADIPSDLWSVDADEAQLVQAFTSVLINARQAVPRGGVIAIHARNVHESERRSEHGLRVEPGAYVRVSITDEGIGIPKEHIGRLFDPDFSTKHQGIGLGLATTYSIIKNHGGFLAVDSRVGHGTTVHVNLPMSATADDSEQSHEIAGATGNDLRRTVGC
jgi:PAS domain S-box-containing protein